MLRKSIYLLIVLFQTSYLVADDFIDSIPVQIPYTSNPINVDGDIKDWNIYFEYVFQDTMTFLHQAGDHQIMIHYDEEFDYSKTEFPLSKNSIESRVCWDLDFIYFAFRVKDEHLYAEIPSDASYPEFHLNDAIEIYIDSKNDSRNKMDINDYQFIVDILNNSVVLKGDRKYIESDTMAAPKDIGQNIYYEYAVVCLGSVNDDNDTDQGYIIEVAIPFIAIGTQPETGKKIKLDLCIDDPDYSFSYAETLQDSVNLYFAFNWSGLNDFGYPNFWKTAELTGGPGWYERLSAKYEQYWPIIYGITLIISLFILLYLFIRIRKLKKLPAVNDLKSAQLVIFSDAHTDKVLSHNQKILQDASRIITVILNESIRSEALARELGISLRNLQRITKAEMNCTPTNFIWLVKLKLAAEFLKNKEGNVSEAAYEFGFSNPSHFSRMFKNHFGVSPSEFQRTQHPKS